MVKNQPTNERRDAGWIPGLGRFPGGGHGNPCQYSRLENPKDRGAGEGVRGRLQSIGSHGVGHG